MAALLHIVNPSLALRAEYERVNVSGTANVIQAAQAQGVQRVVFFSTIAVYGHGHRGVFTEATPPQPDSLCGASKLAAEQLVLGRGERTVNR
jgi:UDP-glucose 4-epimerase